MIDQVTAAEGAALLSSAIAELMEGVHEEAVDMTLSGFGGFTERAGRFKAAAADMGVLAQALEVLGRCCSTTPAATAP